MRYKTLLLVAIATSTASILLAVSFYIRWWPLELLVTYAPLLSTLLLICLLVIVLILLKFSHFRNNYLYMILIGGVVAVLLSLTLSFILQQPIRTKAETSSSSSIKFATFNKLYSNERYEEIASYFSQQDVNIITVQESLPGELEKIRQLLGYEYIYTSQIPGSVDEKLGIISKFPIKTPQTTRLSGDFAYIRAEVETPKEKVNVYSVHVPPPAFFDEYKKRNEDINSLAKFIKEENEPVIIGGDFNTTVFSPVLREFSETVDQAAQLAILDLWPACSFYGFGELLCSRIDHVYLPNDSELIDITISPDLGSDHRAVVIEFEL